MFLASTPNCFINDVLWNLKIRFHFFQYLRIETFIPSLRWCYACRLAGGCPHLATLNLEDNHYITSDGLVAVADSCMLLTSLNIAGCRDLDERAITSFTSTAMRWRRLETVRHCVANVLCFLRMAWSKSVREKDWRSRRRGSQATRAPCVSRARHSSEQECHARGKPRTSECMLLDHVVWRNAWHQR